MINLEKKLKSPFTVNQARFPRPVFLASGTIAFGTELAELINITQCGGLVLKGTSIDPKPGNPPPRIIETPAGMLNSIGLQNPGIHTVLTKNIPAIKKYKVPLILNIFGKTDSEYEELAKMLSKDQQLAAVEVNLSCPNAKTTLDNGSNPKWIEGIVKRVKKHLQIPVFAKLSPNTHDVVSLAKAAENGGADGLSLINTLQGMAFDIHTQKPVLGNKIGGLSGPAIKPVALRIIYQVRQKTTLPIIGMGGIMSKEDIFEFFIAGADAVQIGTFNFVDLKSLSELLQYSHE